MQNQVEDQSADRKYFVLTPRIVWAKCRDAYDYTLWSVVKDVAGEFGVCKLGTPDLATLAMMSAGKVQDCRDYLIAAGLLIGAIVRDPGYPQPVYNLIVPDMWEENIQFSKEYEKLKDRIAFKAQVSEKVKAGERSRDESYLEAERSPHEKGIPPHERKKNHKEKPVEQSPPNGGGDSPPPPAPDPLEPSTATAQYLFGRLNNHRKSKKGWGPIKAFATDEQKQETEKALDAIKAAGQLEEAIGKGLVNERTSRQAMCSWVISWAGNIGKPPPYKNGSAPPPNAFLETLKKKQEHTHER